MSSVYGKKKRIDWIDIAKGIGILLVLIEHTYTAYNRRMGIIESNDTNFFISVIKSFFMPLFFFLSGVFIKSILSQDLKKVFINKFKRLMIPYFFWGIIYIFFWSIYQQKWPFVRLLELPIRPIFVLWFVYSMFLSFIFFWLLQKRFSKGMVFLIGMIFYLLGQFLSGKIAVDSYMMPLTGLLRNFIFVDIGFLLSNQAKKVRKTMDSLYLFLVSVIFLILLNICSSSFLIVDIPIKFITAISGIVATSEFSRLYAMVNTRFKWLQNLGIYSMEIYLIHKLVVEIVSIIMNMLITNKYVFMVTTVFVTIFLCFIVIKLIKKLNFNKISFGA